MKINKNLIILLLLLIFCISISTVSAVDNEDIQMNDINNNSITAENSVNIDRMNLIGDCELNNNENFAVLTVNPEDLNKVNSNSEVYVSANGNDENDGTYNNPYKTFEHALAVSDNIIFIGEYILDKEVIINKNITLSGVDDAVLSGNKTHRILFVQNSVAVTINDLTFKDGNSSKGGAIYFNGVGGSVIGGSFVNCSSGCGGAIYFSGSGSSVSGCSFVGCDATVDGGAIYFYGGAKSVNGCSFVNCSSGRDGDGGAIYFCDSGIICNCSFVACSAGRGGAIHISGEGFGNVSGCSFVACSAGSGGAIYFLSRNVVGNCSFVACSAGRGGAIYFKGSNFANVSGCSFVGCSATVDGGAIYISSKGSVNYCIFDNNKAVNGIDIFGDYSGNYDFNFFSFKNDINFPKNLIGFGKNSVIPNYWVVLDVTNSSDSYFVKFVTDEGNSLSKSMPDYSVCLSINGVTKEILIKNNTFNGTFVPGNYLVTSLNSGDVLANRTYHSPIDIIPSKAKKLSPTYNDGLSNSVGNMENCGIPLIALLIALITLPIIRRK